MDSKRASRRKHHIVYKTTCAITGRYYIGLHSTDNLDDDYLGSGIRIIRSVAKYGRENHTRVILEEFDTRIAASDREKQLITLELRADPLCLNSGAGGLGAVDRPTTKDETRAKLSAASKQYVRTKEWYEKAVATRTKNDSYKHTDEAKKKISEAGTGRTHTEETRKKLSLKNTGQKRTAETCENISKSRLGKSIVLPPFSVAHKESIRAARIGKKHSEEAKANMRKPKDMSKNMRACTVDGIVVYPSVSALVAAVGSGKSGSRSPHFRYVLDEFKSAS